MLRQYFSIIVKLIQSSCLCIEEYKWTVFVMCNSDDQHPLLDDDLDSLDTNNTSGSFYLLALLWSSIILGI